MRGKKQPTPQVSPEMNDESAAQAAADLNQAETEEADTVIEIPIIDGDAEEAEVEEAEAVLIEDEPEEADETEGDEAADDEAADDESADDEAAEDDEPDLIGAAMQEAAEYKDRFLRLQAEWDNYRKRTASERESERKRATEKLVEKLLPVVDDLERALEHTESASEESLAAGIAAVHSKLLDVLSREGVKVVDPIGEAFNADLHQAVGQVEDTEVYDETVSQVYQKGYLIGDRCLRPAMVVVATGGPQAPAAASAEAEADEDPEEPAE